ncbi:DUF1559 domain-containing protein [Blastopirellula sp. JC732]|uniref:DUF1559 domain-containing protein n=1 Tax=Blastopirellula sediminis TaxID=2894196 RepID=A0A9X1SHX8_9BACT|nr:DUF1559 domain-containing protein [Blastopirellula sediminis]MCC9604965.1 DUF1559 domain-containing protein [Blastopirellula sediminis]MCC9631735.1 DUF1559 domain-containing protein [Blastopirellula sediminis]
MPISFTCPHCGTQMEIDESYAGQTGPCAICAKEITIPQLGATGPATPQPTKTGARKRVSEADQARMPLSTIMLILGFSFAGLAGLAICGGGVASVAVPAIKQARRDTQNQASRDNLKRIAAAMDAYYSTYDAYPPAVTTDAKGKPMHSWRVLLLPFLGHSEIYSRYNLNVPWDDPMNMQLVSEMPNVYRSFDETGNGFFDTRFVVIRGKETLFPDGGGVTKDDIKDEYESLLLVVEKNGPGVNWMQPDDLILNRDSLLIENDPENAATLTSSLTGNAVMADGEAFLLPDMTSQQLMRDMATRKGQEEVHTELHDLLNEPQY